LSISTDKYKCDIFGAGLWETAYTSSRLSVAKKFHVNVFSTKTATIKAASIPALMNTRRDGYFARAAAGPKVTSEIDGNVNLQWFVSSVITEIKDLHHAYGGESVSMVYCKTDFLKNEIILKCSRGACSAASQKKKWNTGGDDTSNKKQVVVSCNHVRSAWDLIDSEFGFLKFDLVVGTVVPYKKQTISQLL